MAEIEGWQCDHCGARDTAPATPPGMRSWKPPERGWFVQKMPQPADVTGLWFCSRGCVREHLNRDES